MRISADLREAIAAVLTRRMGQQRGRAKTIAGPEYAGVLADAGMDTRAIVLADAAGEIARNADLTLVEIADLLAQAELVEEPGPPPAPEAEPPPDDLTPPTRAREHYGVPPGHIVEPDTHYVNPQGSLVFPERIEHVTVTGAKRWPGFVHGWRDVWVQGTPERPMEGGPRSDGGDICQIKRGKDGVVPEDLTFRWFYLRDVTRPVPPPGEEAKHPDGVQIMCGRRLRFLDGRALRVSVQPFFARDAGVKSSGGPIEDVEFARIDARGQAEGYYTWRISGDQEEGVPGRYVPTRVRIIDCTGDRSLSISAAARRAGSEDVNYRVT